MSLLLWMGLAFQVLADSSLAGLQAPLPQTLRQNEVFEFKPQAQHHFSEEAPQSCGQGQSLISKDLSGIKCQFIAAGEVEPVLNVCDDKKTFCKPVRLQIAVSPGATDSKESLEKNQSLNHDLKAQLTPDFEVMTPIEARKAAAGRPVLLMISADWCPPCNEAKEHLLPSKSFKAATANWLKIYVDGDALAAKDWNTVVGFEFYPSFVLLNPDLQEIGRFLGPIRQSDFTDWVRQMSLFANESLEKLKLRLQKNEQPSLLVKLARLLKPNTEGDPLVPLRQRLLDWALLRQDKPLIESLKAKTPLTLDLEIKYLTYHAQELSGAEKVIVLKQLLDLNYYKDGWMAAVYDLCSIDQKACEPYLGKFAKRFEFMKKKLWTQAEVASFLAEEHLLATQIFQTVKRPAQEKQMAEACVAQYKVMASLSALKLARSAQQGMLACLDSAQRFAEAQTLVDQLIQAYPNEPTFLLKKARLYKKQKKFTEALVWAQRADKVAYGYNWFALQALKAELLLAAKKVQEAIVVVDSALAKVPLDEAKDSREQQVVARLRALRLKAQ
jgi:thiol-disulfide isomerase/thioredoxin